jgi:hypothetical protein
MAGQTLQAPIGYGQFRVRHKPRASGLWPERTSRQVFCARTLMALAPMRSVVATRLRGATRARGRLRSKGRLLLRHGLGGSVVIEVPHHWCNQNAMDDD